jgi:O-antigen/teichoic acid export membrane protein
VIFVRVNRKDRKDIRLSTGISKILVATAAPFPAEAPTVRTRGLGSVGAVVQSVGAKFFIIAINAATGILSARALQPAGRGELAAMILWPIFLASALTFGLPSALTFRLRSSPEKRSRLLGAALILATLTGLIGALAGVIFMHAWIPQYSHHVIEFARLFVLNAPMTAVLMVGRAALESDGDFTASNKVLVIPPALTLLWLIVLWRVGLLTPVNAAVAYVVVGVPPFIWMLVRLWRMFQPSVDSFLDSTRSLLSYGIRAYGIDLCGTMSMYIDQALVVRALAPQMMGTYVVALSLSRILNAFHSSVVMVLFPKAVSQAPDVVRQMTSRAARISTLLTALAGVGIVSLGPHLLSLLYGREYTGATTVLRILVLEVVLSGGTFVLSQAFMALERPGVVTALQVIGLLFTLPLMLVLIPRLGIVGAGLALLASTTARLIFVLVSFPLFLKMRIPNVFPMVEDLKFMAVHAFHTVQHFRNRPVVAAEGAD